mgnify:CR=1 FL=1
MIKRVYIGDLAKLFLGQGIGEDSAIAQSLGKRWDEFVDTASPMLEDIIKFEESGSLSIGKDVLSFSQVKSGSAGISGLSHLLKSGSFDELGAQITFSKQENKTIVDPTKLLAFQGPNSDKANEFISEIGKWELSDDRRKFYIKTFF